MKKIFNITTITVIILILGIVMLFCSKINEISIIENIRQKIAQTEEIQNASEITTIDVTDLEDNGNMEHEHILKTMYDENKHWEECTICGQKTNESNHNYEDNGWTMGNSCSEDNLHKFSCICGSNYTKSEKINNHKIRYDNDSADCVYYRHCTNRCGLSDIIHECIKSDGSRINCVNPGKCSLCGFYYAKSSVSHYAVSSCNLKENCENRNLECANCGLDLGYLNYLYVTKETDIEYKIYASLTVVDGHTYYKIEHGNGFETNSNLSYVPNINGKTWTFIATLNLNEYLERGSTFYIAFRGKYNNISTSMTMNVELYELDNIEPIISNIAMRDGNEELTEWSKTKPIIISGTENYTKSVTAKIIDNKNNIIYQGTVPVNDKKYLIKSIPEIEVDKIGKAFTIIVTDSCNNSASQEFTIAKVDSIPPTPTSGTEILEDWAKSKNFTFTATDYGIGQVSIAFNDIEDLQLAKEDENTYSRDYIFTGDVYKPKQLSVMYKDGLGNTSMQKITIDKIDNTAPTITNVEIHNNTITITSNDEHETLGEGSGVVKYRYLASEEKIENPTLTIENSTEVNKTEEIKIKDIYKMKYIYIVAEDYVGNTSEVYEFKVPELKLTATANPNTANGKGEIILDWSSYDVTDKYFVIYRKKENQEEWDTIVSLKQKLTGSTYIDTLANDEAKPNTPSITITGDKTNNNINVIANTTDNGTQYNYYIEAYDSTGELLSKSN